MKKYADLEFHISPYFSDYEQEVRPWKERLFSWPWCPWKKTKTVHSPKIYQAAHKVFCSYATYRAIMKAELEE